jgi:hypothetical protein
MLCHAVCVINTCLRKSIRLDEAVTLPTSFLKVSGSNTEFDSDLQFLWFAFDRLDKSRDNVVNYLPAASFPFLSVVRKGIT